MEIDKRYLIVPTKDRMVRHPNPPYRHLRPEGEKLELSSHWRRRARAGDVLISDITSTEE